MSRQWFLVCGIGALVAIAGCGPQGGKAVITLTENGLPSSRTCGTVEIELIQPNGSRFMVTYQTPDGKLSNVDLAVRHGQLTLGAPIMTQNVAEIAVRCVGTPRTADDLRGVSKVDWPFGTDLAVTIELFPNWWAMP